jgi:hypothetical protein
MFSLYIIVYVSWILMLFLFSANTIQNDIKILDHHETARQYHFFHYYLRRRSHNYLKFSSTYSFILDLECQQCPSSWLFADQYVLLKEHISQNNFSMFMKRRGLRSMLYMWLSNLNLVVIKSSCRECFFSQLCIMAYANI